jgi:hypothetical protein
MGRLRRYFDWRYATASWNGVSSSTSSEPCFSTTSTRAEAEMRTSLREVSDEISFLNRLSR